MIEGLFIRCVLQALSMLFGSLGVFFIYLSFLNPAFGVHAVISLAAAMGFLWAHAQPQE